MTSSTGYNDNTQLPAANQCVEGLAVRVEAKPAARGAGEEREPTWGLVAVHAASEKRHRF